MGENKVSVDITPTGHGHCVVYDTYFVEPLQKQLKFGEFTNFLSNKSKGIGVYYIQKQNNNFNTEFGDKLGQDIQQNVSEFGAKVFDCLPDAVNFWMGDDQAVSSIHKDHYENMYCVVKGQKNFTLLPPTDLPYLYKKEYKAGNFVIEQEVEHVSPILIPVSGEFYNDKADWKISLSAESKVAWVPLDPDRYDVLEKFPKFKYASPLRISVKAGEVLYLPSLVYHRVSQQAHKDEATIAINYWFDMKFDLKYCYYKFLEGVVNIEKVAAQYLQEKSQQISNQLQDSFAELEGNLQQATHKFEDDEQEANVDDIFEGVEALEKTMKGNDCKQQ